MNAPSSDLVYRSLILPDGVAFTGEFKLVRKATGYEKGRRPVGTWVRRLREPTFPVPFDRISDPQIPLTRHNFNGQYLNGNDFFNNAAGTPRGRSNSHQFGGSVGGPIKTNKLFFFIDYEAMRNVLPAAGVVSLPSPQLEEYAVAHVPAASIPLYQDMFSLVNAAPGINRAVPVTNGGGSLQNGKGVLGCGTGTFPGTPAPSGGTFGVKVPCAIAFGINDTEINTEGLFTARVDYNVTDKQKLFSRYSYDGGVQATGTSPIAPEFDALSHQPQDTGSVHYTYVITPTIVNNFVGSAFWYSALFGVADFAKTSTAAGSVCN